MTARAFIGCVLGCVLGAGAGQALDYSMIPIARPGSIMPAVTASASASAPLGVSNQTPLLRSDAPATAVAVSMPRRSDTGFASPIPLPRPRIKTVSIQHASATPVKAAGGSAGLCGVRDIRGQRLSAIPGKLAGCGVAEPVQVTELAGVRLSTPAVVDCITAKTLRNWIEKSAKPTIGRLGGGLKELRVAASYSCRPRNSQPGAKISEHGKGHAIDISALRLNNDVELTVLKGWNDPVQGKLLRKLHRSACGPFGTVLGPESDRYHKDHFHFDTARYRAGSYCR